MCLWLWDQFGTCPTRLLMSGRDVETAEEKRPGNANGETASGYYGNGCREGERGDASHVGERTLRLDDKRKK